MEPQRMTVDGWSMIYDNPTKASATKTSVDSDSPDQETDLTEAPILGNLAPYHSRHESWYIQT